MFLYCLEAMVLENEFRTKKLYYISEVDYYIKGLCLNEIEIKIEWDIFMDFIYWTVDSFEFSYTILYYMHRLPFHK